MFVLPLKPIHCYAWFNSSCYHPPRATPGDKYDPYVGKFFKRSCPGGTGLGQSEITACAMASINDCVEFFAWQSVQFVGDWLNKNNFSKLKAVFEGKCNRPLLLLKPRFILFFRYATGSVRRGLTSLGDSHARV